MWAEAFLATWGCIPELTQSCQDMTNASSTYLSVIIGAFIGAAISWLIYSRQKYTSDKQDHTLKQIKAISDHQEKILDRLNNSDQRHDRMLKAILELDKRIDLIIEKKESSQESEKDV
jgi:hypothetical protein